MTSKLSFDEIKECECKEHAQDSRGQCGGLASPNVARKQARGATMTDKEIRSDEAAVVQKRSEETLRDSEERYRTMIGNLPGFVYRCENDRHWTMSFISDGCRDITGYAPEDFLHNKKLTFNDIIRQDYRERVWVNVQDCLQQKKAFQHEYPIVVASGETDHWVWERGRGIFSDAGQLLYIEGFITDITERKQAEETLYNERLLLRTLIDNIPDSIYSKELAEKFFADDQLVMQTGEPVLNREEYILDEKQQKRWLLSSKLPLRNQEGRIIGLVGIGRDITERKQAETQLRQSQKMEAIGKLAGGVAHDFNNLLTGILGNITIIRSTLPPADPLLENLDGVETAARQAADLTKGLLTFSRSAVVLPVPTKIADALDTTLVLLKQSLPATMKIVRDYELTAWNVLVDQSQITQILLNLAVNARDAMKGKGTLTIRRRNEVVEEDYVQTHPFARTGEFVHLSVTDTGPGIPPVILEHLFEPFHTTKPVGSGTGLGLSIVYGAVKQAGGWITAASTEGVGVTFDIYLARCMEPRHRRPSHP